IFTVLINRYVHQGTIMRATLAFIICMLLVQHAFADSHALRAEEKECGEHMSYKRISSCFSALYIKADQELNDQYSRLSNSIDAENRSNLVTAQRLWVKFREADCLFSEPRKENDHIVSSGHSICLTRRTLDRLEQLENYNVKKGCNGCAW
ncbi:lysozyme inhibitor LprI family protein, partial [Aeromonas simiae]